MIFTAQSITKECISGYEIPQGSNQGAFLVDIFCKRVRRSDQSHFVVGDRIFLFVHSIIFWTIAKALSLVYEIGIRSLKDNLRRMINNKKQQTLSVHYQLSHVSTSHQIWVKSFCALGCLSVASPLFLCGAQAVSVFLEMSGRWLC